MATTWGGESRVLHADETVGAGSEHGSAAVALAPQVVEPARHGRSTGGRFTRGNHFATKAYRQTVKRDPHYHVQRALRDAIGQLRTGAMPPGVAMALVALLRLQLELVDRAEVARSVEVMEGEIEILKTRIADLLAAAARGGAR